MAADSTSEFHKGRRLNEVIERVKYNLDIDLSPVFFGSVEADSRRKEFMENAPAEQDGFDKALATNLYKDYKNTKLGAWLVSDESETVAKDLPKEIAPPADSMLLSQIDHTIREMKEFTEQLERDEVTVQPVQKSAARGATEALGKVLGNFFGGSKKTPEELAGEAAAEAAAEGVARKEEPARVAAEAAANTAPKYRSEVTDRIDADFGPQPNVPLADPSTIKIDEHEYNASMVGVDKYKQATPQYGVRKSTRITEHGDNKDAHKKVDGAMVSYLNEVTNAKATEEGLRKTVRDEVESQSPALHNIMNSVVTELGYVSDPARGNKALTTARAVYESLNKNPDRSFDDTLRAYINRPGEKAAVAAYNRLNGGLDAVAAIANATANDSDQAQRLAQQFGSVLDADRDGQIGTKKNHDYMVSVLEQKGVDVEALKAALSDRAQNDVKNIAGKMQKHGGVADVEATQVSAIPGGGGGRTLG